MGRSSSRSSSREDKKKRKRDKDDKKKKKSRSRSTKKESKRKRSTSRDKKKKRSSESVDHKKKKSRSRDRKKRSHSRDKKKKRDRSDSKKKQGSKENIQSAGELTEEQKLQIENQKKRERLARMKMLKFQDMSDSDDDDDDNKPVVQKPTNNAQQAQNANNQLQVNQQSVNQQLQQENGVIQQGTLSSHNLAQSTQQQQVEIDPLLIEIQQSIAAQVKQQNNQGQNSLDIFPQSVENSNRNTQFGQIGDAEEEIQLEKNPAQVNQQSMRYVEDFMNYNDDSNENQFYQEDRDEQNNPSQMEEENYQKREQNDSDDLQFDNSEDEEEQEQNRKSVLNGNSNFNSEKLKKLQMMNQQQNDGDEYEGGLFGSNKQQQAKEKSTSNNVFGNINSQNSNTASKFGTTAAATKTIEISQQSMNTSIFTNNKTINQQQLVDEDQESDESDLDLYMRQLEEKENEMKGLNQNKNDGTKAPVSKQNYITMEEILGKKTFKEDEQIEEEEDQDDDQNGFGTNKNTGSNSLYFNTNGMQNEENEEDDDDEEDNAFHLAFKEQMKKIKEDRLKDITGNLMMDEEQEEEEEREAINDPENGESKEDYMERLKREAMKKELKPIEYNEEDLEPFQKNFYIESREISLMSNDEVKVYRENLGDIAVKGIDAPRPIKSWLQSGLSDRILDVLIHKKKYDKPFPIQCQSLPVIMSGRDMIGIAETGSGKTLAYLLPMIRHVSAQRPLEEGDGPIGIILVPTRELATQIYLEAKPFLKPYKYEIVAVFGGTGIKGQLSELKRGCEIVVATPGRLIDVLTTSNGKITNLKRITMVVIDEADRMFDLGFEPQIAKILATTRPDKQTALFSATFPKNVENLAKKLMRHKPCEIVVGARGQACTNITQIIEIRDEATRLYRLLELLGIYTQQGQVIIFVDKQIEVDFLYKELRSKYYIPTILHAGVDADDRLNNLLDFRKGIYKILIATSVSSRGIDVKNVVLVVNYRCPNHIEDYIHRIGRTGRAGNKGTAVTFLSQDEDKYSLDLIKALKRSDQKVPDELMKLGEEFKRKVKMGEAKIYNNANMQGKGFNFDEEEKDKLNQAKYEQKKFLALQMGYDIEEKDDEFMFSKKAGEEGNSKDKKEKEEFTLNQKVHIIKTQDEYKELRDELMSQASQVANQKKQQGLGDAEIKKAIEEIFRKGLEDFVPSTKNVDQGKIKIAKMLQQFEMTNDIANNICFEHLEINDYPENARKAVCKRDFLDRIHLQTGCLITQKGILVEVGKKVQPGFQKQYLRIEGDSEYQVRMAYRDIKAELEDKSMQNYEKGVQQGRFTIA